MSDLIDAVYVGDTPVVFVGQGKKKKGDLVKVAPHEVYGETITNDAGEKVVVFEGRADLAPAVADLSKATKADLLSVAAARGVEVDPKAKKDEILAAIEAATDAGSATADASTEEGD